MEKRTLTANNKYCISWISITIAYFLGFYMWYETIPRGDYAGLAVAFLFIISAPIFSVLSGFLVYKGTERIFLPNIITIAIMILINLPNCIINASKTFERDLRAGYPTSMWELLFDYFWRLLIFAVPMLIIATISSAITRAVITKRNKSRENKI